MNVYFTEEGKRYHSNRECIKNSKKIYEKTTSKHEAVMEVVDGEMI
jgi:hypothetical protein